MKRCGFPRNTLFFAIMGLIVGWGHQPAWAGTEPPSDPRMAYTASLPNMVFRRGDRISLTLSIKNRSKEPVTIWLSGFWPNHRVVVTDARGKEPPLTKDGKVRRDVFAPSGARDKNSPQVLAAGESHREMSNLDLTTLYELRPGRYRVRATYHDTSPPAPMRVVSNAVAFEVSDD